MAVATMPSPFDEDDGSMGNEAAAVVNFLLSLAVLALLAAVCVRRKEKTTLDWCVRLLCRGLLPLRDLEALLHEGWCLSIPYLALSRARPCCTPAPLR